MKTWVAEADTFLILVALFLGIAVCQVQAQNSSDQPGPTWNGDGKTIEKESHRAVNNEGYRPIDSQPPESFPTPLHRPPTNWKYLHSQKTPILETLLHGDKGQQRETRAPGNAVASTIRESGFERVRDKLVGMKRSEVKLLFGTPDSAKANDGGDETLGFVLSSLGVRTANVGPGLNVLRAHWLEVDIAGGKVSRFRDYNSVTSQYK